MKNIIIAFSFSILISCSSKKRAHVGILVAETPSRCNGSEVIFSEYLFHEFNSLRPKELWFIAPYFDNNVLAEYQNGKQLHSDDNHIAYSYGTRYFEYLSLCLIRCGSDFTANEQIRKSFHDYLHNKMKLPEDSITMKISKLYEK